MLNVQTVNDSIMITNYMLKNEIEIPVKLVAGWSETYLATHYQKTIE